MNSCQHCHLSFDLFEQTHAKNFCSEECMLDDLIEHNQKTQENSDEHHSQ